MAVAYEIMRKKIPFSAVVEDLNFVLLLHDGTEVEFSVLVLLPNNSRDTYHSKSAQIL